MKSIYIVLHLIILTLFSSCSHFASKTEPSSKILKFNQMPKIGSTLGGQDIILGGLSSLTFIKKENNKLYFWAITDRGPNAEAFSLLDGARKLMRPFILPEFTPLLVEFSVDLTNDKIAIVSTKPFKNTDDTLISGLPPLNSNEDLKKYHQKYEIPVNVFEKPVNQKTGGMDSEGFCRFHDTFLVSEEYGPDLLQFDMNQKLIHHWSPGHGLPDELSLRKINRGIEGLACNENYAYLLMQSPLPSRLGKDVDKIRLIKFNPETQKTEKEFFYPVDATDADKMGDLAWINKEKFITIEQNGKIAPDFGIRKIYQIDLAEADQNGILTKHEILDINKVGLDFVKKIEGVAVIDKKTIALVVDNDFGFERQTNPKTGIVAHKSDTNTYLAIVHLTEELK